MRIGDLMSRDVSACRPNDTLALAARIMEQKDCGCLPVVDGGERRVVGVVTDRDICLAGLRRSRALHELAVRDAMSKKVYRCTADQEVGEAERTMSREQVRRLPVVDADNRLVGMLSLADLALEASREHGRERRDLSDREIGDTLAMISRRR